MLIDFYNIWLRVYRDNMRHKSYWFAQLTYIMLPHYLGEKLISSFQRRGLCRVSTLRLSVSSPIHHWPGLVKESADCLQWAQLSLLLGICLDNGFHPKAVLTQCLHFHHCIVSGWNVSHVERDVKLENNIREQKLLIWFAQLMTSWIIRLIKWCS